MAGEKDILGQADGLMRRNAPGADPGAVPVLTELVAGDTRICSGRGTAFSCSNARGVTSVPVTRKTVRSARTVYMARETRIWS